MWQHVLLFVFVFAEASVEGATSLSTYQPFLPSQRVDVQLLPSKNEDMERALDSDPENLLAEAVRLLQIDNIQTLERKLLLIESSLKETEEEVQTMKVGLENAQKAYGLALEEATSTHLNKIQAMSSELGRARTSHALEIEKIRSTHQDEIQTMKLESEMMMRVDKKTKTFLVGLLFIGRGVWILVNFIEKTVSTL